MAFHYQNLIQEKDFLYPNIMDKYKEIKLFADSRVYNLRKTKKQILMKNLINTAKTSVAKQVRLDKNTIFTFNKRQERILIVNNILFNDDEYFINKILNDYNVSIESIYNLKDVLNELDRKDEDYLDGTMEALVRYHIPAFDIIAKDLNIGYYNEFIIWKLMEIVYLKPELLEHKKELI